MIQSGRSAAKRRDEDRLPPYVFTPKARLQLAEFLITCAKKLLQQHLPEGDIRA
jgi:hypothetical protein